MHSEMLPKIPAKLTGTDGRVIWITGLSGAGKSTLATEVVRRLRASGVAAILLDGDALREVFGITAENSKNHKREARLFLAFQYARLGRILARQGLTVVIATICLFREIHTWNRQNLPGYFEIYLRVPIEELRRRDTKGLYRRFDAGELSDVAGLDLPIDEPAAPDSLIEFDPSRSVDEVAREVMIDLEGKFST